MRFRLPADGVWYLLTGTNGSDGAIRDRQAVSSYVLRSARPPMRSLIGALSQATSLPVTTLVTCPTVRIHPAVDAQAAATAGRIGDGFVTMQPDASLVEQFRRAGGGSKQVVGGLKGCWNTDRDQAVTTVHRLWPNEQLPGELAQILPTPDPRPPTPDPRPPSTSSRRAPSSPSR